MPKNIMENLKIVPVKSVDDVLPIALVKNPIKLPPQSTKGSVKDTSAKAKGKKSGTKTTNSAKISRKKVESRHATP
jgi:predicted ATP-dependent protease